MNEREALRVREIRVHGVSGTPPHAMLGVHDYEVEQVSGDSITGLYRCRAGSAPAGVRLPDDVGVTAYSWGALTSGASGLMGGLRRAAWLTLLPFALGNLSYWARPELDERGRSRVATAVAVRVACLALTLLLTASMCVIGIDMVAWQCFRGGTVVCPSLPSQLQFLGEPPWDAAPVRMLFGSLLPVAVLTLLWWLSRSSLARYEAQESQFEPTGAGPILRRRRMWAGDRRTTLLQRLHVGAGLLLVVTFGLVPVVRYAPREGLWWAALAAIGAAIGLLAATVIAVAVSYRDGIDFPGVHRGFADRLARVLPGLSVLSLVVYVVLMVLADIPERFDDPGLTRGRNALVGALIMVLFAIVAWLVFASDNPLAALLVPAGLGLVALVALATLVWAAVLAAVLLAVCILVQHSRRDPGDTPRAWRGAGAAMVLGAAVSVALLFTTSLVVFVGNWLNGAQSVTALQVDFDPASSPGVFAARVQQDQPLLLASGPVVVRQGVLERSGPGVYTLLSGQVEASSVTTADGDLLRTTPDLDLTAGMLLVNDPPLQLVDGCIVAPGQICADGAAVDTWVYELAGPLVIHGQVPIRVDNGPQEPLVVPQVLILFSGLTVVWAGLAAAVALIAFVTFRATAAAAIARQVDVDGLAGVRRPRSVRARLLAGYSHRAERLLSWLAVVTCGCGLALVVTASGGWQPWRTNELAAVVTDAGLLLAVLMSGALIILVGKLMNASGFWRAVGVLWDLTTFWPRVAHPLGPPCYAERVVPEVVDEVMNTPAETDVVLSGHSQGSLICVAVLSQVAGIRGDLSGIRFVSYGSQLRSWYARIFPGVLGPGVLGNSAMPQASSLRSATPDAPDTGTATTAYPGQPSPGSLADLLGVTTSCPSWVNLFRRTDPIGFRVFGDAGSIVDRYVSEYDPAGRKLHTHSDMQFSAVYADVVQPWYGQSP